MIRSRETIHYRKTPRRGGLHLRQGFFYCGLGLGEVAFVILNLDLRVTANAAKKHNHR
jgi:hypothetical protein